jgi:uncharacterized membrane protein
MSERALRGSAVALAFVGAALAAYVLFVRETGASLVCATGGCATVQSSRYSELLGIPVAALGLAAYLTILAAALAPGEAARLIQAVVALTAFVFSTYLLYVQLAVVGAVCDWCLASDAVTTTLAGLALLRLRAAAAVPSLRVDRGRGEAVGPAPS